MWTLLLVLASLPAARALPSPVQVRSDSTARVVTAAQTEQSPTIDGHLTERLWDAASRASDFRQVEPVDGAAPGQRTEVMVAFDGDALYVAARMHDDAPDGIVARLGRRDADTNSDVFLVAIDSYHDHRTAFRFSVNAAGIRGDDITSNDAQQGDNSWDPVWDAAARIDSAGWTVEMRIPFSQLRFPGGPLQEWGINFERFVQRTGELDRWRWVPNSETGYASHFGHLAGLRSVAAAHVRRLELVPYAVAQGDHDSAIEGADPFRNPRDGSLAFGADVKYGLSSGLTLTGTVNPDFGQVEADPAEVNLTVFETFFQERRPFFVEGANLFNFGAGSSGTIFGAPQLFYSRRIGRAPSGGVPQSALFADVPEVTSILGAAKLSGVVGGWSLGVLDAVTARESARVLMPDGTQRSMDVEPRANAGVVSLRRDLDGGQSGIGLMATSLTRALDGGSLDFLRKSAHSAGLDFFHRFGGDQYSISGTLSGSTISGSTRSIMGAQRSSARYYQRPDQDYVRFDSTLTRLSGYAASLSGGKDAGRWLVGSDFIATSPGFEINDAGFLNTADRIFLGVRTSHRWLRPTSRFRFAQAYVNASQQWNYGGTIVSRGVFGGFFGQFRNYWSVNLNSVVNPATLSDKVTRGGPLALIPFQWSLSANVSTDSRRSTTASLFGSVVRNRSGGYSDYASLDLRVRPSPALNVSLAPSYSEVHSAAGYVTAITDATAAYTYGRRYIVADLTQRSFDMTLRTEMALTPALSLQLYAQPFTSAVEYSGLKSFTRANEFEFLVYGRDGASTLSYDSTARVYQVDADGAGPAPSATFGDPNFTLRSLRANFVLRWEYRAGSTLYLAWAHGRSGFSDVSAFDVSQSLGDLLHDDQRNRLLLKLSYWFNP